MAEKKSDPKSDPVFRKIVRTFLETPPKPHKDEAKRKPKKAARSK